LSFISTPTTSARKSATPPQAGGEFQIENPDSPILFPPSTVSPSNRFDSEISTLNVDYAEVMPCNSPKNKTGRTLLSALSNQNLILIY